MITLRLFFLFVGVLMGSAVYGVDHALQAWYDASDEHSLFMGRSNSVWGWKDKSGNQLDLRPHFVSVPPKFDDTFRQSIALDGAMSMQHEGGVTHNAVSYAVVFGVTKEFTKVTSDEAELVALKKKSVLGLNYTAKGETQLFYKEKRKKKARRHHSKADVELTPGWHILLATPKNARMHFFLDGEPVDGDAQGELNFESIAGIQVGHQFEGYLCEIRVFSEPLSVEAQERLERELSKKWNITLKHKSEPKQQAPAHKQDVNEHHEHDKDVDEPEKPRIMTDAEFELFKGRVEKEPFYSNKLGLIQDAMSHRSSDMPGVSSEQCRQIMLVFSFGADKIKAAKLLYPHIKDKENFHIVYEQFSYSNDKEKLRKFALEQAK
jgi:hypothetical protein